VRRVLITGSSRGLGKAIAFELAESGFSLTLHGRTESEQLVQTKRELEEQFSAPVNTIFFDQSDRKATREALTLELESNGAFYGLVLSAGVISDAPFPGMQDSEWDGVINTNLGGFYNVTRALLLPMIQARQGGRIVLLSSISALTGNRGQVNYAASKAALIGATKSLARELAKREITVNCVAPGPVDTDMLPVELKQQILSAIPMQRLARADEVAAAVGYLFAERSGYMTGQTLVLSGGLV
jgi:3-oxoacyl-[acyl-carrier protein] reductase